MKLHEYITDWNLKNIKPKNEDVFIDLFIEWLNSIDDCRDVVFDGEGSYFGRQVSIVKDSIYKIGYDFGFEISYDFNHTISVYTDKHNGYWWPEYIKLNKGDDRFEEVALSLKRCLLNAFGLNN